MSVSFRKAINQQCHDCVAADKRHSWVKEVEKCCGYSCPLYHLRPVRAEQGEVKSAYRVPIFLQGWKPEVASRVGCAGMVEKRYDHAIETLETDKADQPTGLSVKGGKKHNNYDK